MPDPCCRCWIAYERVEIEYMDYAYFDAAPPAGSLERFKLSGLVKVQKMKKFQLEDSLKPSMRSISI
jgi:hypothetical protein